MTRTRSSQGGRVRVLHLITDLNIGGAELTLARLVTTLDPEVIESSVISLSDRGPVADQLERCGVPVYAVGVRAWSRVGGLSRLISRLRRIRPDVLQTWLYHADLTGTLGGLAVRVPHIVWNIRCADLYPPDHSRLLWILLRLLAFASKRPSAVVSNSFAGKRAHEAIGYSPRRWVVIPNGCDTERFCPSFCARDEVRHELGLSRESDVVGQLARFHPMKDHATFLEAARIVCDERPNVHFVAAGRGVGDNASLARLVDRLGLRARVQLLAERHDPARFLAALDVTVSASYSEAFPNVVAESMACGTPCVATDVGDSARIVGGAGLLVQPRDPAALAAGVLKLLRMDRSSRRALGGNARQRIIDEYSLAREARGYEDLYLDLVSQRGAH